MYQAGFRHWGKRDLRAQKIEEEKGIFFPSNWSPCLFFSSSRFSPAMPHVQTIPLQCILTSSGNDFRKRSYCSRSDFRKKKWAVFQQYISVERSIHHTKHYLWSKVCNMCFFFLQCRLRHKHWKVNIFDSKLFYFCIKKIWKDEENDKINFTSN